MPRRIVGVAADEQTDRAHVVAPLLREGEVQQIGPAERIGLRHTEHGDGDEPHHQQAEERRLEQRGQQLPVPAPTIGVHPLPVIPGADPRGQQRDAGQRRQVDAARQAGAQAAPNAT